MRVIEYVTEEVIRQGHDVTQYDGIVRVSWMLDAWCYAFSASFVNPSRPTLEDIRMMAHKIEPDKNNKDHYRRVGVRVGTRVCPPPSEIEERLHRLWSIPSRRIEPIEFYKEFEIIHPFVDGNGRTGKILLNWMNSTLWDPVFPPSDLFGDPIRNP